MIRRSSRPRPALAAALFLLVAPVVTGPVAAQQNAAAPPPAPLSAPISLADYQRLAADCRLVADKKGDADDVKRRLQAVKTVTLPSGANLAVDTAPAIAAIVKASAPASDKKVTKADAENARLYLRGFASVVAPQVTPAPFAPGDPQKQAAAIVAEREFRDAAGGPQPKTWWDKFIARVLASIGRGLENFARWIGKLFGRGPRINGPNMTGFGEVVLFILEALVALAAVVAVVLLTRYLLYRYSGTGLNRKRKTGDTALDLEDDIADPLAAAHDMASQGDLRSALRYVYIASLRRLEGAGALVLERNKTNWEYQRMLRGRNPAAYETLLPATRLFDRVWYGRRQPTQTEYDTVVQAHDALLTTSSPDTTNGDGDAKSSRDLVGSGKRGAS